MFGILTHCGYFLSRTRLDLTPLMHTLRIPAWPSAQTRAYLIPRLLARKDNLRSLTLPSFDLHILRHHSAFCLRDIQLGDIHLRRPRLSSSLGLMARPISSPCDFRSYSMMMAIRHFPCTFPPSQHIPASSPHPPRQVNQPCLPYHHCCLLRR